MSQTHEQLSYSLATYDHIYYGRCPSQILGWQSRDPNCPACVAMMEVDHLHARVLALEATEIGAKEAFGVVVQQKHDIEAECRRLRELLESAHAQIRRMASDAGVDVMQSERDRLRARVAELDAERKRLLDSLIVASIELDELRARTEAAEDERDQFAEALQAAVRANKAQPECSATNTPTAPARQYFYKNNACQAADSADSDCICWHDEGTGPRHEESHGVRLRWREAR